MNIKLERTGLHILTIIYKGNKWKEIHTAIFGLHPDYLTQASKLKELETNFYQCEYRLAKQYVMRRLSKKSYYSQEMANLLKRRLITSLTLERIIGECQDKGYFNDAEWLEQFMRSNLKKYSLDMTLRKLRPYGVPHETIEQLGRKWRNPEESKNSIRKIIDTRSRSKDIQNYKERQKLIRTLMRKGYQFEEIFQVLETV